MDLILSAYLDGPKRIVLCSVPAPECPVGSALVRVAYTGICGSDLLQYRCTRVQEDQPIGHEFSGRILIVNDVFSPFSSGDHVCVGAVASCGTCSACRSEQDNLCPKRVFLPAMGPGGFSEIAVVPTSSLYRVPPTLHLQDAAVVEPFAVALHALRKGGSCDRKRILVVGAGTIGLAVCQLARIEGFEEISVVCRYPFQATAAYKLGAIPVCENHSIPAHRFDMVVNTVPGSKAMDISIAACVNGGSVVICGGFSAPEQYSLRTVVSRELNIRGSICYTKSEFNEIVDHMAAGTLSPRLLVTHKFDFDHISDAFSIADNKQCHKSIKVLVAINRGKK